MARMMKKKRVKRKIIDKEERLFGNEWRGEERQVRTSRGTSCSR